MCNWHLELWGPSRNGEEAELAQASAPGPAPRFKEQLLGALDELNRRARSSAIQGKHSLADYRIYTADCSGPDFDSYDPARHCESCGVPGVVRESPYGKEPCESCGHEHRVPKPQQQLADEDFG